MVFLNGKKKKSLEKETCPQILSPVNFFISLLAFPKQRTDEEKHRSPTKGQDREETHAHASLDHTSVRNPVIFPINV